MSWRHLVALAIATLVQVGCGPRVDPPPLDPPHVEPPAADAGTTTADAGSEPPYEPPEINHARSLFWTQPELVDDPTFVGLARLMALIAPDDHGGRLLDRWFRRFSTTAHSERALPAQWMDQVAAAQGADPSAWDLAALPFKVTGIHNRIDLAMLREGGHCGELRVSLSSVHPDVQPFHVLFLFRQVAGEGDTLADGTVTCAGTARRWAELSRGAADAQFVGAARTEIASSLTRERFLMAESVELSVSPWEWRQWVPVPDPAGELLFVFDNPPLFQTADVEALNAPGPLREDFLSFVAANAAALDERRLELPERFRRPSARVSQGVPRTPLDLGGLASDVAAQFPKLRHNVELIGCPACHTADAEFVQTRTDRTVSPFYEKELEARERHLGALARGTAEEPPFGPLQLDPRLPP